MAWIINSWKIILKSIEAGDVGGQQEQSGRWSPWLTAVMTPKEKNIPYCSDCASHGRGFDYIMFKMIVLRHTDAHVVSTLNLHTSVSFNALCDCEQCVSVCVTLWTAEILPSLVSELHLVAGLRTAVLVKINETDAPP